MIKHEFIIRRDSHDEHTFARITFECIKRLTVEQARETLTGALTKWATATADGLDAWHQSSEDFNIGDLAMERLDSYSPPTHADVQFFIYAAGLHGFSVETFCCEHLGDWSYDSVLMDGDAINEIKITQDQ